MKSYDQVISAAASFDLRRSHSIDSRRGPVEREKRVSDLLDFGEVVKREF